MSDSTKTTLGYDELAQASLNEFHYGIADWHPSTLGDLPPSPQRSPHIEAYFSSLWPMITPYVSKLNPVFLLDLPAVARGSKKDSWLVRDGLIPLLWFFHKNPNPGKFSAKLWIHASFEEFVPDAWRDQVALYEIFPEKRAETEAELDKVQITEVFLMGGVSPSICSLPQVQQDLERIVAMVGQYNLPKTRIRALLPIRYEPTDRFVGTGFHNRVIMNICKYLGTPIEFLEFEALQWMYPSAGALWHEFNEKWLYADSYLTLLALSKGIRLLPQQASEKPYDKILPLYPHVSCGVRKTFEKPFLNFLDGQLASEPQAKAFFRAMDSAANRAYPWDKWFTSWCKDF